MEIVFICTHLVMAACATVILSIALPSKLGSQAQSQEKTFAKSADVEIESIESTGKQLNKSHSVGPVQYIDPGATWLTQSV